MIGILVIVIWLFWLFKWIASSFIWLADSVDLVTEFQLMAYYVGSKIVLFDVWVIYCKDQFQFWYLVLGLNVGSGSSLKIWWNVP